MSEFTVSALELWILLNYEKFQNGIIILVQDVVWLRISMEVAAKF